MKAVLEYLGSLDSPRVGASYLLPMSHNRAIHQEIHSRNHAKKSIKKTFHPPDILNHEDWTDQSVSISGHLN